MSLQKKGLIKEDIVGLNTKGWLDESVVAKKHFMDSDEKNYVEVLESNLNKSSSENSYENSLAVKVHFDIVGEEFNYVSFGCLNVLSEINAIVGKLKNKEINAITIPHYGNLNLGENEFSDSFWKSKKASNFAALFNGPFGLSNNENKNLYPMKEFKYSSNLLKENDGTSYFYANKKVDKKGDEKLDKGSLVDMAMLFRYPYYERESVQCNQFYYEGLEGDSRIAYFSNYNLKGSKYEEYKATKVSSDASSLLGLL